MMRALIFAFLGLFVAHPVQACMLTPAQMEIDFKALDTNSDGKIDMVEHEKAVEDFKQAIRNSPYSMMEDTNKDGVVTLEEYKGIGRKSLSPKLVYLTPERIERYFAAADANKDGKLTPEEYFHDVRPIEVMHKNLRDSIFGKADADKDGFVSKAEFEDYQKHNAHTILTMEQYEAYFKELDADADGTLTKDEYFKPSEELMDVKGWFYGGDTDNNGSLNLEEYESDNYRKPSLLQKCGGR
ncbi:MAG: hypothetical protein EB060_06235 [Proteobacteria bacterium]|nr:hypothetical protein [Pseudomonadota bacterium]